MTEPLVDLIQVSAALGGPTSVVAALVAWRKSRRDDESDDLGIAERMRQIAGDEVERARDELERERERAVAEIEAVGRYWRSREARLKCGVESGEMPPWPPWLD